MGIKEYERNIGYGEDGLKTILEENLSKLTPSYEESYILDRTRAYHNLLQNKTIKRGSQAIQSYIWDFNVAYMEEGEKAKLYMVMMSLEKIPIVHRDRYSHSVIQAIDMIM